MITHLMEPSKRIEILGNRFKNILIPIKGLIERARMKRIDGDEGKSEYPQTSF